MSPMSPDQSNYYHAHPQLFLENEAPSLHGAYSSSGLVHANQAFDQAIRNPSVFYQSPIHINQFSYYANDICGLLPSQIATNHNPLKRNFNQYCKETHGSSNPPSSPTTHSTSTPYGDQQYFVPDNSVIASSSSSSFIRPTVHLPSFPKENKPIILSDLPIRSRFTRFLVPESFDIPPSSKKLKNKPDEPMVTYTPEIFRALLVDCATNPAAVLKIKESIGRRTNLLDELSQAMVILAQKAFNHRVEAKNQKLLNCELYLGWLQECSFIVDAVKAFLAAKLPQSKKRLPGMGRYAIRFMYSSIYECSKEFARLVETPREESASVLLNSSEYPLGEVHTAARQQLATQKIVELLETYDVTFYNAVQRYRAESDKKKAAPKIKLQEDDLGRSLWILSQKAGIGKAEDMGFYLLKNGRDEMRDWANAYADEEPVSSSAIT